MFLFVYFCTVLLFKNTLYKDTLSELKNILENDTKSLEEKQKEIESLNTPFSSKIKNLSYQINPSCLEAIKQINNLLNKSKARYKTYLKKKKMR